MMENKDMLSKRKTNKLVILLAVIFLASAAGLGGIYAWRAMKNNSSGNGDDITHHSANVEGEAALDENGMPEDGSDITETKKASDVKTLRELLLEDGKFAIKLTDDIRIERGFLVNGTKKLVGNKSITMELYAEPFQPILKVQQGATLILDGITLDGNSNAIGVEVDKKAGFTSLSGTILYPIPYGVLSHGTTRIKDIKIDRGIDSGLCVMGGSKAYMEGGEISGCSKAAIHVVANGYVHISGDAKLNDSYMCINNRGVCEITGGVISDAWRTLIWNLAELTVNYEGKTKEDKLEWYNAGEYGIRSGADTKTYINGVYIHDVVKGGIKGITHDGLVVKNCKVENVGTYGVESAKGKQDAVFTDIEVINAKNSAVRVYGEHKVEVTNVTVTNTEGRGIQNGNSHVIAKNIKITNSKLSGIYGGKGSITDVSDVEIISSQRYGTENVGGQMTIKNAKVTDAKLSGVFCRKETVNNLSNVDILRPGKRGIYNLGGTVTADKIVIDSPVQYGATSSSYDKVKGSLTISNLTVRNVAEESGLICNDSVITAKNVTITDVKTYGARVIGGGTLTIADIKVQDCGMRGIAASDDKSVLSVTNAEVKNTGMSGIVAGSGATAKLENIYIKNAGLTSGTDTKYSSSYRAALATTDGTVEVKNVTINDAVGSGVYVNGGTLTAEQVIVNRAGENGAFFTSSKTNGEAVIKMTDVDIQAPQNRGVYNDGGTAELINVKITKPKNYGVTTASYSKDYAGSVTINGLNISGIQKRNALNCNASKMTVVNGTITDVPEYGAYVLKGGNLTLTDVTFSDVAKRGVWSEAATATLKNVEITGAQYGVFVDGGTTTFHGGKVTESGTHAIYVTSANKGLATADIKAVTIHEAAQRGVYNYGGNTTLTDVTITNPGTYGVTTGKADWTVGEETTTFRGKVTASNLTVTGVKGNNALNCNASEIEMTGGSLSNVAKYGAYAVAEGVIALNNVNISKTGLSGVYAKSGSDVKLTTVVLDQVGVTEDTETKYEYQDKSGIGAIGATVKAEDVTITNAVEDGIYIAGCTSTLKDIKIQTAKYGLFMDGGTITEESKKVEIDGVTASGTYIKSTKEYGEAIANIEDLTVTSAAKRAVYNVGAKITLTGTTTITNPGEYGITSGQTNWTVGEETTTLGGKVTVKNLTMTGVQKNNALNCNASEMDIQGGTISDVAKYGAYVTSNGQLKLQGVNISKTGYSGVYAQNGATIQLTNVGISKVGLTADDCDAIEKSGVGVTGATVTADTLTISEATESGVYSASATTTLKSTQISTAKYGVYADGGTTTYEGGQIASVSAQGIYITSANNGLATVNMASVNIHEVARRGVHNNGGNVTLTGVSITDPGEYGISSGTAKWTVGEETTTFVGKVTATDLTITGVKKNNALHCNASEIEVTGGKLSGIKENAARVVGSGSVKLNNIAISQCEKSAISVQKGTATMTGGTITGIVGYDVDMAEPNGDANVTLTGVSITRAEGNTHGSMIVARGIKDEKTGEEYGGTTTLTLDNCNLTGSGTPTTESAITVTKGTLNIQNGGTYKNNVSGVRASVIYVDSTGNVNINQGDTKSLVSFTDNGCNSGASAASGGVINVQDGGTFKADTCAFTNNYLKCSGTGTCTGGAISVGSKTDGNVVIKNATFDGNRIEATKGYGGAISVGGSCYLTMENCVFGQTTPNAAANGKDVRGANGTVFNLSGKIVAEFFNTQYVHTLQVVDDLTEDSNIIMRWNKITEVEEDIVIRFAESDLVTKNNKACFALHEVHESTHKFAFGSTIGKIRKK